MTGTEKRRATDFTVVASRRAVWEAAYAVAFVKFFHSGPTGAGGFAAQAADRAIEELDKAMRERARQE